MKKNAIRYFIILAIFSILALTFYRSWQSHVNERSMPGIETGLPEEVGMNADMLTLMAKEISHGTYPNIHSVLIAKNNKLVYEGYFEGQDESWGDSLGVVKHDQNSLHDIRSVTKSIVSACIGMAINEGKIGSVEDSVFSYFPQYSRYREGARAGLTLRHPPALMSTLEGITG